MKTAAVIFDMDGLLFDTERLYIEQSRISEKEFGLAIPEEVHWEAIGKTLQDAQKVYAERYGRDFPVEDFMHATKELVYRYIEENGLPVKPGALELLRELKDRGFCVILASSSPRWMIEKNLQLAGLTAFFDFTVSGEDVERGKPAPDIFLQAAALAGVDPGECVVLEDSNNGIRAAFAAGMRPVMVPDIKPPEPDVAEMVYRVCRDLTEAKDLVCR
jgi:HAD superfamily hydrolase (TIGR01509 family)